MANETHNFALRGKVYDFAYLDNPHSVHAVLQVEGHPQLIWDNGGTIVEYAFSFDKPLVVSRSCESYDKFLNISETFFTYWLLGRNARGRALAVQDLEGNSPYSHNFDSSTHQYRRMKDVEGTPVYFRINNKRNRFEKGAM